MHTVFVYGTLKKGRGNHSVLGKSTFIDYAISRDKDFKMFQGGFPVLMSGGTGSVTGELYQVHDDRTLHNLDGLESNGSMYSREQRKFIGNDGKEHTAWVYLGSEKYWSGSAWSKRESKKDDEGHYVF